MGKGQRDLGMGRVNGYELFLVERLLWGVVERDWLGRARRRLWDERVVLGCLALSGVVLFVLQGVYLLMSAVRDDGWGSDVGMGVVCGFVGIVIVPVLYFTQVRPYLGLAGKALRLRGVLDEMVNSGAVGEVESGKEQNFVGRIEGLKRWRFDCGVQIFLGIELLVVALTVAWLLLSMVVGWKGSESLLLVVQLVVVVAWWVYKGSSVVVSEEGVRWRKRLVGREQDGFVEWGEVRGLYRVASEMGELVFYVLDGERDGLVWGVPRQVEGEEEAAMERFLGVIVARTDVALRDITGVVQASLSERDFR